MAKEHSFEMYGHPSIYNPKTRKLKIYFLNHIMESMIVQGYYY